jgi:DNA-binding GntR family transcriptional regulator
VAVAPRYQTKTELALQALRERIRSGELQPGQRLRVEELTRELGMSPTPIREALRLLQADRLIDYRAHQGIVIAELSPDVTEEVYRLRALLEPLAMELAVPRLTDEQLEELERLHEMHAAAVASGRGAPISERNWAWHWALYNNSGSPLLNDFIRRLWEAFPWRTMWALPGRTKLSLQEHDAIMDAVRARDLARAARRLREHVLSGRKTVLAQIRRELSQDE